MHTPPWPKKLGPTGNEILETAYMEAAIDDVQTTMRQVSTAALHTGRTMAAMTLRDHAHPSAPPHADKNGLDIGSPLTTSVRPIGLDTGDLVSHTDGDVDQDCEACNGAGQIDGYECSECEGTGTDDWGFAPYCEVHPPEHCNATGYCNAEHCYRRLLPPLVHFCPDHGRW